MDIIKKKISNNIQKDFLESLKTGDVSRIKRYIKINLLNILYKRHAIGKDGNIIIVYKLRTYKRGSTEMLKRGPLPIGKILDKTWLNEIPQIINLLKGDLQLIGARPFEKEEYNKLSNDTKEKLKKYKPGIIGFPYAYKDIDHKDSKTREELLKEYLQYIEKYGKRKTYKIYIRNMLLKIIGKGGLSL